MGNKRYMLFAGVNGAGKSTLYDIINSSRDEEWKNRINTDEIVNKIGDWSSEQDQIKAARIGIQQKKDYFRSETSFNQETTLTGNSIIKGIIEAKKLGYEVIVNYVSVESSDIAKQRVKDRVKKGGHDIPEKTIEKRYIESLKNMQKIIPLCDEVRLYDNTSHYQLIAKIEKGEKLFQSKEIPNWAKEILSELPNKAPEQKKEVNHLINLLKSKNSKSNENER